MTEKIEIISFYEFREMGSREHLETLRAALRTLLVSSDLRGTIILAHEGFNGMVCGLPANMSGFVDEAARLLGTRLDLKTSFHAKAPFRRIDVKIKPEIVTLKQPVDMSLGSGTHVRANRWNDLIRDPGTLVLDTRNDYEYRTGTFRGAVNPDVSKFSELPSYVAEHLDPEKHKRVAMFCTGGIRCEKFAPYLKQLGFAEVYQLEGGILRYLENVQPDASMWEGECFVFDDRISVDASLEKGSQRDHSQLIHKPKNGGND